MGSVPTTSPERERAIRRLGVDHVGESASWLLQETESGEDVAVGAHREAGGAGQPAHAGIALIDLERYAPAVVEALLSNDDRLRVPHAQALERGQAHQAGEDLVGDARERLLQCDRILEPLVAARPALLRGGAGHGAERDTQRQQEGE